MVRKYNEFAPSDGFLTRRANEPPCHERARIVYGEPLEITLQAFLWVRPPLQRTGRSALLINLWLADPKTWSRIRPFPLPSSLRKT
jgi:hypothetical protein